RSLSDRSGTREEQEQAGKTDRSQKRHEHHQGRQPRKLSYSQGSQSRWKERFGERTPRNGHSSAPGFSAIRFQGFIIIPDCDGRRQCSTRENPAMSRQGWGIAGVGSFVIVAVLGTPLWSQDPTGSPVVVTVNDQPITEADL